MLPSILSGALLIMLYSMAHFGTVAVLGIETGIFNIPTLIYEKIHQSAGQLRLDPHRHRARDRAGHHGGAHHVLQNKVLSRGRYQIIAGKSFRPLEIKLRGLRMPMLCFCIAYIGFTIVLPDGHHLHGGRAEDLRAAVHGREPDAGTTTATSCSTGSSPATPSGTA